MRHDIERESKEHWLTPSKLTVETVARRNNKMEQITTVPTSIAPREKEIFYKRAEAAPTKKGNFDGRDAALDASAGHSVFDTFSVTTVDTEWVIHSLNSVDSLSREGTGSA